MSGIRTRLEGSILLLVALLATGCAASSKGEKRQSLKESAADTELNEQALPPAASQPMPEAAREGFNQEPKDSPTS